MPWWRRRDLSQRLFALDLMCKESQLASFLLTRDGVGDIIPEQTVFFIHRTEDVEEVDEACRRKIWKMIRGH